MSDKNSTCSSARSDSIFSVSERDAGILGLAACESSGQVRVAEHACHWVAEYLLGDAGVRVAVFTAGIQPGRARGTGPAGDRERDHHPVTGPEPAGGDVGP